VPASVAGTDGFDYRFSFRTADGGGTSYLPAATALHVASTRGLRTRGIGSPFSWSDEREPDDRELFLPYGDGPGEVGLEGGGSDRDLLGPSSFAVEADGSISVVDWVNDRVQMFHGGSFGRSIPTPSHRTFDIAVGPDGRRYLLTLGTDGAVTELSADGRPIGRYPSSVGAPFRVRATSTGPAVEVGPAQWISVRSSSGVARSAPLQAATVTAAPIGSAGESARIGSVDEHHVAITWARTDGPGGGVLLELPRGARAGTPYLAEPLPGGGTVVSLGLWNENHNGVGLFELSESGTVSRFSLLPEPSTRADARASTVRFQGPDRVLVAFDHRRGMSIDGFDLGGER
jgi:hypothetical protein